VVGLIGPGILGGNERAIFFNADVVFTSTNPGETIVTPVFSPRVSHEPVLLALMDTVADDGDGVD